MRKTLNINLGGLAFIIDENAFELLHNYLETLKRKFGNETEREEILNDIEARIGEMLSQKLAVRKEVVSVEDVQAIMNTLGKPEDIAGEETTGTSPTAGSSATSSASASVTGEPIKKKLYRDPDDAKIGGVISGLCHYFGISDPVWARIAALVLIPLTSGSIILFYLLLLIIVPKANTSAEKLQMKGEPVNINTIEKEIKDAAGRAGESVHRFVKDQNFFERLWDIIVSVGLVILKVFAIFFLVIATVSLIGVLLGYTELYVWGTSSLYGAAHLLVEKPSTITLFGLGFLLFCAPPFIAVIYLALRTLIGRRSSVPWLKWTLLGGWLLGLIFLLISLYQVVTDFKSDSVIRQQVALAQPANGNLYVQLAEPSGRKLSQEDEEDRDYNLDYAGFFINGVNINDMEQIPVGKPALQLLPSENDSFYIQEIISSKGRNKKDADGNADMITYSFAQTDTVLNLSPRIYLPKTGKWRRQEMILRIAVPEGKKIGFADNIDFWEATVKGDNNFDDTKFANTSWTVESGKIKCIAGENHRNVRNEDVSESRKIYEKIRPHAPRPPHAPRMEERKHHSESDKNNDDDKSDQDF